MKISHLLIIGMFALFFIFAIYGLVTFDLSIQEMRKFLGTRNEGFSFNIIQGIDQTIESRITDFQLIAELEEFQNSLELSNQKFSVYEKVDSVLQNREEEIEFDENTQLPSLRVMIDVPLSQKLRGVIQFYNDEYDHQVVEELLITNAYGATIGFGQGKSDYRQDDEEWWQTTKTNGLYIGELSYHEIYDTHGIDFGFRIDDDQGKFLGVMRVLITLDDMLHEFVNEAELINIPGRNLVLLDNRGAVIYSNGIQDFANSKPVSYFDRIEAEKDVGFFELTNEGDIRLISYAKSTGYKTFEGFDWIVLVEQNSSSLVEEFVELRNSILIVSIIGMGSAVVIGIVTSFFITNPLKELSNLAKSISKGNFDVKAGKSRISEIEVIGESFNQMAQSVKRLIETEKKLAEANARVKNERLTAMGEVASSMAHNMKNPLATIRSSADIVKRNSKGKNEDIDKVLERMERAIVTMSHQIEGVLNFVRTTPLESTSVSVRSLLDSAIESIEIPQNISLELPQSQIQIKCDAKKMEIVFINLILNAIQSIGNKQGKITIRVKEEEKSVVLEFEDSGPGIPKDLLPKIFEPLVTTKEKGTGLGLSSSKNIILQHGGTIEVKNNPTTFTIKLPKES